MATYLIMEIDWHDQDKANEYRSLFGPALDRYGGKTLCAGPGDVIEGTWAPPRVVVLEFPDARSLKAWYASPEYAPVLKLRRDGATTSKMVSVEGPKR